MRFGGYMMKTLLSGLLVVAPLYLATLLLLKAMQSLAAVVRPLAKLLPDWLPADGILSLLLVLLLCVLVGILVQTRKGKLARESIEQRVARTLPGYSTVRSLTQRLLGESDDKAWKPALAEIEEALVPAFVIEELDDGRLTVFVPSVPTPLAGAVYILVPDRVHVVDVPFAQAVRVVSQWGSGSKHLLAAMQNDEHYKAGVRKSVV
jgi:uncharacterized membrane protein